MQDESLWNGRQVQAYLGISDDTLRRYRGQGIISYRIIRQSKRPRYRYDPDEIRQLGKMPPAEVAGTTRRKTGKKKNCMTPFVNIVNERSKSKLRRIGALVD